MRGRRFTSGLSIGLAIGGAIALHSEHASAHEPWTYGYGSRATAMGGALVADTDDFSANYYNPAGIVDDTGIRVGLGYFYAENNLRVNDLSSGVKASHGVFFGIAASGNFFGLPIGLGIATHVPDEGLSRLTALRQDVPRWELYDNRSSVLYLAANLAIRPVDFLELGGGISFLASTRGRFEISGVADLLFPYNSQLRHEVDVDLTSVRYPQAGVLVHLSPAASMGVTYRGQTAIDLRLNGKLDTTIEAAGFEVPLTYELQARTIQAFLPQQVVLGTSLRPYPPLHINIDFTWVNWGAYENPTARTIATLEAEIPPQFPIELPGELRQTQLEPIDFSDRIVPRIGVEWYPPGLDGRTGQNVIKVPIRAGYVFEKSPIPPQTGKTNFVDADRHTISFGVGIEVPVIHLSFDVHGALSILPERITLKTSPADLTGDYRAAGEMANIGATLTGDFR
ncbi:MAG: hypothetical protein U0271_08915 [Polyangiaceae bacterium]